MFPRPPTMLQGMFNKRRREAVWNFDEMMENWMQDNNVDAVIDTLCFSICVVVVVDAT